MIILPLGKELFQIFNVMQTLLQTKLSFKSLQCPPVGGYILQIISNKEYLTTDQNTAFDHPLITSFAFEPICNGLLF